MGWRGNDFLYNVMETDISYDLSVGPYVHLVYVHIQRHRKWSRSYATSGLRMEGAYHLSIEIVPPRYMGRCWIGFEIDLTGFAERIRLNLVFNLPGWHGFDRIYHWRWFTARWLLFIIHDDLQLIERCKTICILLYFGQGSSISKGAKSG